MINWKKIVTIILDIVMATYLVFAFTAFNQPDESGSVCNKITVNIADEAQNGFITAQEIKHRLEKNHLYPLAKPMRHVSGRNIEELLKQSPFVKTAECYKTQNGQVIITITQRMPVVRIKSDNNDDYYIDDNYRIMPNSNYTSDLIIATGNINRYFAKNYISPLAKWIMDDDFWRLQIEQIHVLSDRSIELVPRVGNHIVYLGALPGANTMERRKQQIEKFLAFKMDRLMKFYKYGLASAGWNKYSYINLEFNNQIICTKRDEKAVTLQEKEQ